MFTKLQHLDANCFHVITGSTKIFPTVGVSVSPVENFGPITRERREQRVSETPDGDIKRTNRLERNLRGGEDDVIVETGLNKLSIRKKTERKGHGCVAVNKGKSFAKPRSLGGGCRFGGDNARTKCSTKWVAYGGCIPEILQALEKVQDLDEALRPWEGKLSDKVKSVILNEQLRWERALEIFEWLKRNGLRKMNVIHYNIMLRILGRAQKWSHVEGLWNEMNEKGIAPVNSTYGTLIDVYSKAGLMDKAVLWIEGMKKRGMELDEVTVGIVVQSYKKARDFEKAEEFFKNWLSTEPLRPKGIKLDKATWHTHVCSSPQTYNIIIDTYGKAGQIQEACKTFWRMLEEGIRPTTVTFNTMIHICGNHGKLDEVALLMKRMQELHCQPDTRTYNILISLHTKNNNIEIAAEYFRRMKESLLEPDLVSYRTLLYGYSIRQMVQEAEELVAEMDEKGLNIDEFTQSALTRMYVEAALLEKSWWWFWRFHLAGNMSSECYSANLDGYGEHGHTTEAEKVFICCQEARKLNVLVFNVMIKAYGKGHSYDKACQLFDTMGSYGVTPDKCSYSSLIQILAEADMPHIAKPYLRRMHKAGLMSDCIPYCAVMSSFAKLGQLEMVEDLYKEMIGFGVQPDLIVFGVLINAFADAGCVKEAILYTNAMRRAGLPENTVICNTLMKLYAKVGYLKEAKETYKLLQSLEEGPSSYSSNCMIYLYSKQAMVEQAEKIFESLKRKGDANEFTYAMMLCMYKKVGSIEKAIQIAIEMRNLGELTDLLSYNNLIGLYASTGKLTEAVETFIEMTKFSIQPDGCTFRLIGVILMKCGYSKHKIGKLEKMTKKDFTNSLQAWMSALISVVDINYYRGDLTIFSTSTVKD